MKTIIHCLILLLIGILMNSCDPHDKLIPSEQIEVLVNNLTIDTLSCFFHAENGYPIKIDSVLPNSIRSFFVLGYWDKSIRDDVFTSIFTDKRRNKNLIITSLLADTLTIWDDNSAIFTDKKYWTIKSEKIRGSDDMLFYCTLNLTDEVLKLK